jgi:hypothetical protein
MCENPATLRLWISSHILRLAFQKRGIFGRIETVKRDNTNHPSCLCGTRLETRVGDCVRRIWGILFPDNTALAPLPLWQLVSCMHLDHVNKHVSRDNRRRGAVHALVSGCASAKCRRFGQSLWLPPRLWLVSGYNAQWDTRHGQLSGILCLVATLGTLSIVWRMRRSVQHQNHDDRSTTLGLQCDFGCGDSLDQCHYQRLVGCFNSRFASHCSGMSVSANSG